MDVDTAGEPISDGGSTPPTSTILHTRRWRGAAAILAGMRPLERFGRNVRVMRAERAWTIEHLAERAEIDPTYLGSLELGEHNPSLLVFLRLLTALSCEANDLLKA
jgi:DNA-binding XRE family transcriptional regulator